MNQQPLTAYQQALITDYLKQWRPLAVVKKYFYATYQCLIANGVDNDEIVSLAHTGLIDAAMRFDHKRGVKFATVAFNWIRKHVSGELDRMKTKSRGGNIHHISGDIDLASSGRADLEGLRHNYGFHLQPGCRSMWESLGVADKHSVDEWVDEQAKKLELRGILEAAIGQLPATQQAVVERRFGFNGKAATKRHADVSADIGIDFDTSVVSCRRAIKKLKELVKPRYQELANGSV